MEFQQLNHFVSVAEQGSMSAAARQLLLSQPTLSRSIRALEEETGVPLFERKNNHLLLTPAGRHLLPEARRLLAGELQLRRELTEFSSPGHLPVRLVCRCIRSILYSSVEAFQEQYPEAQFELLQNDDIAIQRQDYDLMISALPEGIASDRSTHRLLTERFLCAVARNSSYAEQEFLSLTEFAKAPQILIGGHRQVHHTIASHLQEQQIHPKISMVCDDSATACHFVAAGQGILLVPEYALPPELLSLVRLLPVEGLNLTRDVFLSWNPNAYLPLYAQRYRSFLIKFLK